MSVESKVFAGVIILLLCFAVMVVAVIPNPSDEEYKARFARDMINPKLDGEGRMAWIIMTNKANCEFSILGQSGNGIDLTAKFDNCAELHKLAASQKP